MKKLVAPACLELFETMAAREASSEVAGAEVRPVSLQFEVRYLVSDKSLSEQRINLVPKELSVGPRKGTTLADQVYYSKAPFDTDTHVKLLEELERTILESK